MIPRPETVNARRRSSQAELLLREDVGEDSEGTQTQRGYWQELQDLRGK